jgi:pyrrolidone-carboxylate peptidase
LPEASQTGSVSVTVINPNGASTTRPGLFTYITPGQGNPAEVIGIEPLSIIESEATEVTLRGRNLISAYSNGMIALRGPSRAQVAISNVTSSTDGASGLEELKMTLEVAATPPLESLERMAIQVLASRRRGAESDGVFESSKQMFIVLPNLGPVPIAYSANLAAGKANLVVIAGRNLTGCMLDLGEGVTVHMQSSAERLVSGIVTVTDESVLTASPMLLLRDVGGAEVGQYSMAPAETGIGDPGDPGSPGTPVLLPPEEEVLEDETGAIDLTLIAVPGQQIVAPTEKDSAVYNLSGATPYSLSFDWFNFAFTLLDLTIVIPIVHEVHLIPFFDGGSGEDPLSDLPVPAAVGRLLRLRGVGILVALHFRIVIHVRVVFFFGFYFDVWNDGLFNEFPEWGWAFGSVVIGVDVIVDILISLSLLVALVLPEGRLRVIFSFALNIGLHFTFSVDGTGLNFGFRYRVNFTRIGPTLNNLLPCGGTFQLASENGQTVFPDAFGGHRSYYFPRVADQECCVPWNYEIQLLRTNFAGVEEVQEESFSANYCLTAGQSPNLGIIIIVSDNPLPSGVPPTLVMNIGDTSGLRAFFQPVNSNGLPTGVPQDVRDLGYDVSFYLDSPLHVVLDPTTLPAGTAFAVQAGENVIHANITPRRETPQFLSFWPDSVLGFLISAAVAEGREPGVQAGSLPVKVKATMTVEVTLAYRADPSHPDVLTEAPLVVEIPDAANPQAKEPVRELERYEPSEATPLQYVLAVKLLATDNLSQTQTLTFKVTNAEMLTLASNQSTLQPKAPLADTDFFARGRNAERNPKSFFTGTLVNATAQSTFTVDIPANTPLNKLIAIDGLNVTANSREEFATASTTNLAKFVPPGKQVVVTGTAATPVYRHTLLSVNVSATGNDANVKLKRPTARMAVRNDETFEEYLRVFVELQKVIGRIDPAQAHSSVAAYRDFITNFANTLKTNGHSDAILKTQGGNLWTLATSTVHNTHKDDRPLYIARLEAICVLRAYCKRKPVALSDAMLHRFEWPSRGLDENGRIIFDATVPPATRKVVVTGFDPYALVFLPDSGNPSGVVALYLDKQAVTGTLVPVHVRTAVFPVRYADFEANIVEVAVENLITSLSALVTISQNGSVDQYELERWAGKNRDKLNPDNNNSSGNGGITDATRSGSINTPPDARTATGAQFIETTLLVYQVITSDPATQTLIGPGGGAGNQTPFLIDQSYQVLRTSTPIVVGEVRPSPQPGTDDAFKEVADKPTQSKLARSGSGGNFLSNEIFYRTALERFRHKRTLPSGHIHIPPLESTPDATEAESRRTRVVSGSETALRKIIDNLPPLTVAANVDFPATPVFTTSAAIPLTVINDSAQPVQIAAVQMDQPSSFIFQPSSPLPLTVNPGSSVSLPFTFEPTTTDLYQAAVRLLGPAATNPPPPVTETVWVEDALPMWSQLGTGEESWHWVTASPAPFSGNAAHHSTVLAGFHQHLFSGASQTLAVGAGDKLFAYVYLDPLSKPSEVMLQWNDGNWEHRAYWGANQINAGTNGTASRYYAGPLPAAGHWVRLEIPASQVGLEGHVLNGMAFSLFDGRAAWDLAGKVPGASIPVDTIWVDDFLPSGAVTDGVNEQWKWTSAAPKPFYGFLAHQSEIFWSGMHQHRFFGASPGLPVNAGDSLFVYIYIDPQYLPAEVMLEWNDGSWEHRAYWGANLIDVGTNGTNSRRYMGTVPAAGQWVRLEVPASMVGLEGQTLNGMAFTLFNGKATWDRSGKKSAGTPGPEIVWVEDALPAGAVPAGDGEGWNWTSPIPNAFSGSASHRSNLAAGMHQHSFIGGLPELPLGVGDKLFTYVYLDPLNTPTEVMLQFFVGEWEHRAYWGANQISLGVDGTVSRRLIGPLPAAGQWVRLEVAANLVGLEGRNLSGIAYTLFGGAASWDRSGKVTQPMVGDVILTTVITGQGV